MSLINQDNDLCPKNILDKIVKIYESYDLDIDDMTPEEISRICKYYSNNISKLNEDLERSKVSKYSNNKSINKTGNRNVKQKKLIDSLCKNTLFNKEESSQAVEQVFSIIKNSLIKEEEVYIVGFGKFSLEMQRKTRKKSQNYGRYGIKAI